MVAVMSKIKDLLISIACLPIILVSGLYFIFFVNDMTEEQIKDLERASAMKQQERELKHDLKSN